MTHEQFLQAWHEASIRVDVDRKRAGQWLAGKLLLPVFITPVIGLGIALALWGFWIIGALLVAAGMIFPRVLRAQAPRFAIMRAVDDPVSFRELYRGRVISIHPVGESAEGVEKIRA